MRAFKTARDTILLVVGGSHAYGTHNPDSDLDVKGVLIPPSDYYVGLQRIEQAEGEHVRGMVSPTVPGAEHGVEGTIYELSKFLRLAADANPNILDVLFGDDDDILESTIEGDELRAARDLFISAKCKHTFSGYAASQLKRIRTHRRWLLTPPDHKPTREEFDLPVTSLLPADQLAAANALVQKKVDSWELDLSVVEDGSAREQIMGQIRRVLIETDPQRWSTAARAVGIDENMLEIMERERHYKGAMDEWHSFEHWKVTRNPARAALEAQHGYDTKHGMHLVRLMRMCREILVYGQVRVSRVGIDAKELCEIRNGSWSYDKLVNWADAEDKALEEIYQEKTYKIPKAPNRAHVNDLCVRLVTSKLQRDQTDLLPF